MGRRSPEAIRRRTVKAAARRVERKRLGLCVQCDESALPGTGRCQKHRALELERVKAWHKTEAGKESRLRYARNGGRFAKVASLARTHGKEWELSEDAWRSIIAMPCFYCGLPNNVTSGAGLDRLDNTQGYLVGNVVSCCKECNTARNDNFTPDEMRAIGAAIRAVKLRRLGLP